MNRHTRKAASKPVRITRRRRYGAWQPHVSRLYSVPRFPEAEALAVQIVDSVATLTPTARRRAIVRVALVLATRFLEHGKRWKTVLAEPGTPPRRGRPHGAAWTLAEICLAIGCPIPADTIADWLVRQRVGGWAALVRDDRGQPRRIAPDELVALRRKRAGGLSVARAHRELGLACSLRTAQLAVAGDRFDPKRNPHLAVGACELN